MKTITLMVTLFLLSFYSNAQTSFKFNPDGTTNYVVFSIDSVTASFIYTKATNWINETYKNPDKVINAKIENKMIRIDGFLPSAFSRVFASGSKANYDVNYTLEIQIQDGKYRIKYTHNEITIDGGIVFFKFVDVINNIPDINGNAWLGAKEQYEGYVNKLIESLLIYITKPKENW